LRHMLGPVVALVGVVLAFGSAESTAHAQRPHAKRAKHARQVKSSSPDAHSDADAHSDTATDAGSTTHVVKKKGKTERVFDFTGFELNGSTRMPQLLYFLDRANQELERASLQRRSFVPELVRTLDEEAL
jgi:hypothetical protein